MPIRSTLSFYGLSSRYYVSGNYMAAASSPENYDWSGVKYDWRPENDRGEDRYIPDAGHQFGENVTYVSISGVDCVKLKLDEQVDPGEVTTHSAVDAYRKGCKLIRIGLYRDAVDAVIYGRNPHRDCDLLW